MTRHNYLIGYIKKNIHVKGNNLFIDQAGCVIFLETLEDAKIMLKKVTPCDGIKRVVYEIREVKK